MTNFTLVRPEHLNHHGYLFGGVLLKWIDENAWMAASRDYPGCSLVTVAMDEIRFKHQVENGAILRFDIRRKRQGRTSVTYEVEVFADEPGATAEKDVFSTCVTFVRLDDQRRPTPLPKRQQKE